MCYNCVLFVDKGVKGTPMVLKQRLNDFTSGEVNVGPDSWHYHIYKWWRDNGGKPKLGYRENFCHYVRVLVFLVPFAWFFRVPLFWKVRPWMPVTALSVGISVTYCAMRWPEESWSALIASFQGLLITGVLIVCISGTSALASYLGKRDFDLWLKHQWRDRLEPALSFVWKKAIVPFFTRGRWVFYPWTTTLATILVGGAYLLGWETTQTALLLVASVATAAFIVVGSGILAVVVVEFGLVRPISNVSKRRERRRSARSSSVRSSHVLRDRGTSTVRMAGTFVMAKKRRICPFINLPQDTEDSVSYQDI